MTTDRLLKKKGAFAVFPATFGLLWLFVEPLGFKLGFWLWVLLAVSASALTVIWLLIVSRHELGRRLDRLKEQITRLEQALSESNSQKSHCCVVKQDRAVCPLGITAIHDQARATLKSSLEMPNHTFKWLGLSAFNVVHNNRDVFEKMKHVKFEFVTLSPENTEVLKAVDDYFMSAPGVLNSSRLVSESKGLLDQISTNVHQEVTLKHYSQIPTFRIILVDDTKALVSFYERGRDALNTLQIEITESEGASHCILKWFQMFYEKVLLTEELYKAKAAR